jgi:hypothetical protein
MFSYIEGVWRHLAGLFKEGYTPRTVERHILVSRLFGPASRPDSQNPTAREHDRAYLRDRTVIELLMALSKAKGLLNASALAADRCGRYFSLWREATGNACPPLFEVCEALGLKDIGHAWEALSLTGERRIATRQQFNDHLGRLIERVCASELLSSHVASGIRANVNLLPETLLDLYDNKEVELRAHADPLSLVTFRSPRFLYTQSSLSYETERLIADRRWELLLVIAETGEWLVRHEPIVTAIKNNHGASIALIVADGSYKQELQRAFGKQILAFYEIPWWEHNRHMTLIVKQLQPVAGIYFARRLRSPNISPMVLDNPADAATLLTIFITYWKKHDTNIPWIDPARAEERGAFLQKLQADRGTQNVSV